VVTDTVLVLPAIVVFGGRFDISARLVLPLAWPARGLGIVTLLQLVHLPRRSAPSTVTALLLVVPAVAAIGRPGGGRDRSSRRWPRSVVPAVIAIASAPSSATRSTPQASPGWSSR
jgi:hypothetical protein